MRWNINARNLRRLQKKQSKVLGHLANQLMVPNPPAGEIVIFVSDGTVGAHQHVLSSASDMAMQMTLTELLARIKEPPPKE